MKMKCVVTVVWLVAMIAPTLFMFGCGPTRPRPEPECPIPITTVDSEVYKDLIDIECGPVYATAKVIRDNIVQPLCARNYEVHLDATNHFWWETTIVREHLPGQNFRTKSEKTIIHVQKLSDVKYVH